MSGVCTDVATFMVAMNHKVEAHEFHEGGVVKAEHRRQVGGPVLVRVDGGHIAILENVSVDVGGYGWQFCNNIYCIVQCVLKSEKK